ncbi:condensin subunit Smc [Ensifer adhaerens]|nr:condensin subunit Smc [Ensifer adhaerens]
MKFNKLRLLGFKSFVEPSEFVIEAGLTGVVGPNGCGKSNLVEALRWVMGENSYKNMRASGMDDVIFSGSGNRPARNTAEVGLYLDNSDRTAPAAFNDADEIQVTRRIEREQGSVYRINGKEARAKDVQLLFADASTGARSPSMVGQGRIGELIQAKPQARRQLLEEAAGISGLHSRRHEAELRLRAAETNLERLDDVTAQLESQIESLKRQARQATRFKQLSADIRARDAMLYHIQWTDAKQAETEATAALNEATSVVAERAQAQAEMAKNQAVAGLHLPELREDEARAAAALQRLQIARTQLEEEASRMARRRDELERRLLQLSGDIAREEQLLADNARFLSELDAEEGDLAAEVEGAAERAEELAAAVAEAGGALAEAESVFSSLTAERAEAAASRQQMERWLFDLTERAGRLTRQLQDATRDLDAAERAIAEMPDLSAHREEVAELEAMLEESAETIAAAEDALASAREGEAEARRGVDSARQHLNGLETEARTIERMLEAGSAGGDYTAVADLLSVDRGYETALGAALGEDIDAPADVRAARHWGAPLNAAADPALPDGIRPLADFVRAPAELARRLAQVGVVAISEGASKQPLLKPGQRLVSKEGALWRWDGFVSGADAPGAAALRLEQKNRLAALADEIVAAREALLTAETAHRAASQSVALTEAQLRDAREAERHTQRRLVEARDALSKAERAALEVARRRDTLAENVERLKGEIEDLKVQEDEAREAIADTPDLSGLDLKLAQAQADVAAGRGRLAEARAAHDGLARENDMRRRRIGAIAQERSAWTARAANAQTQIGALKARGEEARDELEGLEDAPEELDDKRRRLLDELVKADAARKAAADRLVLAETAGRDADQAAAMALSALAEAREKRGRAEERLVSARERREDVENRIRHTLQIEPHEVFRLTGRPHGAPLPDPRNVEIELDRLRIERERLGAVNLRAEEEQAELSDRLKALIRERDDVVDAIRKLRAAIQNLNKEGRERLIAAFDVVNAQFQRLFTHLFGGGTAELQLIESDDPLEAGLEILARPPGKKPQTMTLLSGGEQALTALALIFAVFLTNPAPICVLDEVDAPLDDHNVERYCNLMDEMSASTETRFVVITHNPITMARMDRLFGVTMAEQGVSQLVSVDLQTAEQLREAG